MYKLCIMLIVCFFLTTNQGIRHDNQFYSPYDISTDDLQSFKCLCHPQKPVELPFSNNKSKPGPFCGEDNKTYYSECEMKCKGIRKKCIGRCPCYQLCKCPDDKHPKCGVNGLTYESACFLACAGIEKACDGKCPCRKELCKCANFEDPKCGVDGKTYGNACLLACAEIEMACDGKCPCPIKCDSDPSSMPVGCCKDFLCKG